jgi:hypothetical protein
VVVVVLLLLLLLLLLQVWPRLLPVLQLLLQMQVRVQVQVQHLCPRRPLLLCPAQTATALPAEWWQQVLLPWPSVQIWTPKGQLVLLGPQALALRPAQQHLLQPLPWAGAGLRCCRCCCQVRQLLGLLQLRLEVLLLRRWP